MFNYSIWQWLVFFFFYCFAGWIIESTYVSVTERRFVNRGFMRGPCLPLYGFGALTILFACSPFRRQPWLVFLVGMVTCSMLEYLTGWLMETLFKTKYWDYSMKRFNLHGRICLGTSLAWGGLSLAMLYLVHGPVEALIFRIPGRALFILVCCVTPVALADFAYAFRTALSIRAVLEKLTELKADLDLLKDQVNDTVAQTEAGYALMVRIEAINTERAELMSRMRFFARDLIRAFPTAYSQRFNGALNEVKTRLRMRIHRGDEE